MRTEHLKQHRAKATEAKRRAKSVDELIFPALSHLNPPQCTLIRDRALEMPESCRINYVRAMGGNSMAAAVKAHCMECVGWDREEVRMCTGLACPLYPYRPFQGVGE